MGSRPYKTEQYNCKERYSSYWHQVHEVMSLMPGRVLEIGIGSGLVTYALRALDVDVVTLDIDNDLKPDVVGSAASLPFEDDSFDVVLCCEVLEHLPYDSLELALSEIRRVTRSHAVVSLPDVTRSYRIFIQVPLLGIWRILLSLPLPGRDRGLDREHNWEVGRRRFPVRRIRRDIERSGFSVLQTYRVFEIPYHRFFRLGKS